MPASHQLPTRKPEAADLGTAGLNSWPAQSAHMFFHALVTIILLAFVAPAQLRIVSLVPVFSEDLCALGAKQQLVGVSVYSDDIPCAHGLPVVNDFASVDAEKIIALHANVVVGIPAQARLVAPLQRAGIRIVLLNDDTYAEIFSNIETIGRLTGRTAQAHTLIAHLRRQTSTLQRRIPTHLRRPRVFIALGTGPIYTVGPHSYIATLLQLAGAQNAVTASSSAYSTYSPEALLQLQPDAIVTDKAVQLPSVLSKEPWRSLQAVQNHRVFIIPNAPLLERPGPRYNKGLSWLIAHVHATR